MQFTSTAALYVVKRTSQMADCVHVHSIQSGKQHKVKQGVFYRDTMEQLQGRWEVKTTVFRRQLLSKVPLDNEIEYQLSLEGVMWGCHQSAEGTDGTESGRRKERKQGRESEKESGGIKVEEEMGGRKKGEKAE